MIEEKKWSQAEEISTWVKSDGLQVKYEDTIYDELIIISNASNQPIYDAVLSIDIVDGENTVFHNNKDYIYYVLCVPPGDYMLEAKSFGKGMCKQFNASICFRDVKGRCWCRYASGILKEIKESSIDFRQLDRPVLPEEIRRING